MKRERRLVAFIFDPVSALFVYQKRQAEKIMLVLLAQMRKPRRWQKMRDSELERCNRHYLKVLWFQFGETILRSICRRSGRVASFSAENARHNRCTGLLRPLALPSAGLDTFCKASGRNLSISQGSCSSTLLLISKIEGRDSIFRANPQRHGTHLSTG